MIYHGYSVQDAYAPLVNGIPEYVQFCDASHIMSPYKLTLLQCIQGLDKAFQYGFVNFDDFDVAEYEFFEVCAKASVIKHIYLFLFRVHFCDCFIPFVCPKCVLCFFFSILCFQRVENGDSNWILPGKFLAFCDEKEKRSKSYPYHEPDKYFNYFRTNGVTTVIRLNARQYDGTRFTRAGFVHRDLYFPDGSAPTDAILSRFKGE